jgi:hypothetical protein
MLSIPGTSMESLHPFIEVLGKESNVKHETSVSCARRVRDFQENVQT